MEPGLLLRDADLPCVAVLRAAAYRTLGATKQGRGHPPAHAGSDIPATRLGGDLLLWILQSKNVRPSVFEGRTLFFAFCRYILLRK